MKNKLLIFLLFVCLNVFGQKIPNTNLFSLQTVVNITGGTSLQGAFDLSIDSLFDPAHGSKTMNPQTLLGFRNYGYYVAHGFLYNWWAVSNAANIANTGWHMPTNANWVTLANYAGGMSVAGGKLKETGTSHWLTPNTGATDTYGFSARPEGYRYINGVYWDVTKWGRWWTVDLFDGYSAYGRGMDWNTDDLEVTSAIWLVRHGCSVVLIKDAACAVSGAIGTYTGNDGTIYGTICIGNQEWMTENLKETEYRNGTPIPLVTSAATWGGLTTGARCIYQ